MARCNSFRVTLLLVAVVGMAAAGKHKQTKQRKKRDKRAARKKLRGRVDVLAPPPPPPSSKCGVEPCGNSCTHLRIHLIDAPNPDYDCLVANMTNHGSDDDLPITLGACDGVAGSAQSPVWTAFEYNDLKGYGSKDGIAEQRGCIHGGGSNDGPLYPGVAVPYEYCGSTMYGQNVRFAFPTADRDTKLTFEPFPASFCATIVPGDVLRVSSNCTEAAKFRLELCNP